MESKDNKNPNGDIEVVVMGLRPGEKLHEELLIGNNLQKTIHPKIQKTYDPHIPFEQLEGDLSNLKSLVDKNKVMEVKDLLSKHLKLYQSNFPIMDHIYIEQLSANK